MGLPSSGVMKASMIRAELKESGTWSINSPSSRKLAKVPSGAIKFSDFYGKSNESIEDFWMKCKITYYREYRNGIENEWLELEVMEHPTFLRPDQILYACVSSAGWGDVVYYEGLIFETEIFMPYNTLSRTIYTMDDVVFPNFEEKAFMLEAYTNPDTGKSGSSTYSGSGYHSVLNIYSFDDARRNGDYKIVKVHFKLSKTLYYKVLVLIKSIFRKMEVIL